LGDEGCEEIERKSTREMNETSRFAIIEIGWRGVVDGEKVREFYLKRHLLMLAWGWIRGWRREEWRIRKQWTSWTWLKLPAGLDESKFYWMEAAVDAFKRSNFLDNGEWRRKLLLELLLIKVIVMLSGYMFMRMLKVYAWTLLMVFGRWKFKRKSQASEYPPLPVSSRRKGRNV
jgi:hypothetical protein